jgi:glycosyltransferase involved in cell wall biosynthesis
MRFLMLNWRDPKNPLSGGAERVTQAYLTALQERGHEAYWFANDFPGASREETIAGIHIVRGGGRGSSVLEARRWYKTQKPFDLVIDQHHGVPWYAPWWSGTNCVAYLHEVLGPIWKSFYGWPLSWIGQVQERFNYRFLYRNIQFMTGSESTQRALHQAGVRNVQVISYGIDLKPLTQLEPKPFAPPLRLIAVARLAPNKRIDHAIEATRILNERGVPTQLTVVGGGEVEPQLREQAGRNGMSGRVTFTGLLGEAEKNARLRQAHLLVHTSVREGWGLNVLEANAMGTPAIVYPVPGLVEAALHDQTGIVTPAETPASVADGIIQLLKTPDKYERFRHAGAERTASFHWTQVLPRAASWLESQAAPKPRP